MKYKILKFGGSSLKNEHRFKVAVQIIQSEIEKGLCPVVVASALGGVTNLIVDASELACEGDKKFEIIFEEIKNRHFRVIDTMLHGDVESKRYVMNILEDLSTSLQGLFLLRDMSDRISDTILSSGERMSTVILNRALEIEGIRSTVCDARECIRTDSNFGNARVDHNRTEELICEKFEKEHYDAWVVTGFIAADESGATTTLGRSGSDYTASIFGSALEVDEIDIWTDVDGVMTADPVKTKDAFVISKLSYEDAMELSHFGAKVIFPPTMIPAMKKNIPINIRNSYDLEKPGTVICSECELADGVAAGIASIDGISLLIVQGSGMVGVRGISARLFDCLAINRINIIMITQASSEHSICIAVKSQKSALAKKVIQEEFQLELQAQLIDRIAVEDETAILAVVGDGMRQRTGVAAKVFQSLGKHLINVKAISQGSSERNISIVISRHDEERAISILHRSLFPNKEKTAVYLIGTGLVGYEFIDLFNRSAISDKCQLNGIMNLDGYYVYNRGVKTADRDKLLAKVRPLGDLDKYVRRIWQDPSQNIICVDCTASRVVAEKYPELLQHGVSVVTPNKIANTGMYADYMKLRSDAAEKQVEFRYETNVGAALPVISTLRNMVETGDEILRIEAVLSGTLSYLFNTMSSEQSFSNTVKNAIDLGYAEPDPREDLKGSDVSRKALILARELGYALEISDSIPESLVSESCCMAKKPEDVMTEIAADDVNWVERCKKLQEKNERMRYIATVEKGRIDISVKEVDASHPFYNLSGPDNIVAIYSQRYPMNPLVIKGAGAGAAVTAGGIMADVLSIVNQL